MNKKIIIASLFACLPLCNVNATPIPQNCPTPSAIVKMGLDKETATIRERAGYNMIIQPRSNYDTDVEWRMIVMVKDEKDGSHSFDKVAEKFSSLRLVGGPSLDGRRYTCGYYTKDTDVTVLLMTTTNEEEQNTEQEEA